MVWNPRTGLMIGGFVALSAIAAAGWMRHPATDAATPATQTTTTPAAQNALATPATSLNQYGEPQNGSTPAPQYASNGDTTTYTGAQQSTAPQYGSSGQYANDQYQSAGYSGSSNSGPQPCVQSGAVGYQSDAYGDEHYMLSTRNPIRVVRARPVRSAYVEEGSADRYVEVEHHHRHHGLKRAVEYTAGGAGLGAAVGAIAGGGRGAGIGALAGGAGGFLYDRVRHH